MPTITLTNSDDILDNSANGPDLQVDTIVALDGNDTILSSNDDDVIYGGAGNDSIASSGANPGFGGVIGGDLVYGGDGDDIINTIIPIPGAPGGGVASSFGDTVFGGAGNDLIIGAVAGVASPTDTLFGGTGNDTIDGNGGDDIIDAGIGDDLVIARAGVDTVDGGAGVDTIDFSSAEAVVIDLASGATSAVELSGIEFESNTNFENVIGTAGDDFVSGDGQDNSINTGAGDDTVFGGEGDDHLVVGAGDDSVDGGTDAAGGDRDVLDYSADPNGVTVIYTGSGQGSVSGTSAGRDDFAGIEMLILSDDDDAVNASADTAGVEIDLGAGDDFVRAGQAADTFFGGTGIDGLAFFDSTEGVEINAQLGIGSGGNADGDSFSGFEAYALTDFADEFDGSGAGETVDGLDGNDFLRAAGGSDTIFGGLGDDTVEGGAGADSLDGGFGVDTLDYSSSNAGVNVSLTTGAASGGHANGDNFGGPGAGAITFENLRGSNFGDVLEGTAGINVLEGRGGNDVIRGLGSGDQLFGGEGDDTIEGGAGSDFLSGGAGADQIDGAAGRDRVDYSDSDAGVQVILNIFANGGHATGDSLAGIEDATGSEFNDFFRGTAGGNSLVGLEGSDYLQGMQGNDFLFGGANDDFLEGGAGADVIDGGDGTDFFSLLDATGDVTLDLSNLAASSADYAGDTVISIEGVLGISGFSNTIIGTSVDEVMIGGEVNDSIAGGGGADVLVSLGGDDILEGGGGGDVFLSGLGNDVHTGGAGRDSFLFEFGDGHDVITDFDLSASEFVIFFGDDFALFPNVTVSAASATDALLTYGDPADASSVLLQGVTEAEVNSNLVFLVV